MSKAPPYLGQFPRSLKLEKPLPRSYGGGFSSLLTIVEYEQLPIYPSVRSLPMCRPRGGLGRLNRPSQSPSAIASRFPRPLSGKRSSCPAQQQPLAANRRHDLCELRSPNQLYRFLPRLFCLVVGHKHFFDS